MKQIYLPLLAVLALASCSKSELAMRPNDGQVEIMATSQALSIDTRAPFEGDISDMTPLKAYVMMSKVTGDYSSINLYGTAGTMTFTDDNTTPVGFDTPQYYPTDDSQIFLCALYPSTGWAASPTTVAKFTFNGSQDVMAAAEKSSKKSDAVGGTVPTFEFNHLLTKLTVKVKAENEAAVAAWGDIVGLSVLQGNGSNVNSSVEVTLADGTAATSAFATPISDGTGMKFYTITDGTNYTENAVDGTDNKITPTTTATLVAYSLVAPITATGTNDFQIKVQTKTATQEKAVESTPYVHLKKTGDSGAFTGNTQGQAFEITITLKATEIVAKATVTDWVDAGSSDVEIQ